MKIHQNIHKKLKKREKHVCFVGNCNNYYLYFCTLKKHIESCHNKEYEELVNHYPNQPFQNIVKIIHETEKRFNFINIKHNKTKDNENSDKINNRANINNKFLQIENSANLNFISNLAKESNYKSENTQSFLIRSCKRGNNDNTIVNNYLELNQQLLNLTNSIYSQQLFQYRSGLLMHPHYLSAGPPVFPFL